MLAEFKMPLEEEYNGGQGKRKSRKKKGGRQKEEVQDDLFKPDDNDELFSAENGGEGELEQLGALFFEDGQDGPLF